MQAQQKRMLLGADIIKPAAQAVPQGEEEPKDRAWLRNLVCGFDMEIPAERLQQDTVGEPKLTCCAWNQCSYLRSCCGYMAATAKQTYAA
jgi:hypothetical protein